MSIDADNVSRHDPRWAPCYEDYTDNMLARRYKILTKMIASRRRIISATTFRYGHPPGVRVTRARAAEALLVAEREYISDLLYGFVPRT